MIDAAITGSIRRSVTPIGEIASVTPNLPLLPVTITGVQVVIGASTNVGIIAL